MADKKKPKVWQTPKKSMPSGPKKKAKGKPRSLKQQAASKKAKERDQKGRFAKKGSGQVRENFTQAAQGARGRIYPPNPTVNTSQSASNRRIMAQSGVSGISQQLQKDLVKEYQEQYNELDPDMERTMRQSTAMKRAAKELGIPQGAAINGTALYELATQGTVSTVRERVDDVRGDGEKPGTLETEQRWRNERGALFQRPQIKGRETVGSSVNKGILEDQNPREIFNALSPSHKQELQNLGLVNAKGQPQGDGKTYLQALGATNASHNEILDWMSRGALTLKPVPRRAERPFTEAGRGAQGARLTAQQEATQRYMGDKGFMSDKYEDSQGSHEGFTFAKRGLGAPTMEELRKRFPNATDREIIAFREATKTSIKQQMIDDNAREAYETRMARIKGKGSNANVEDDDKVMFFTTNLGGGLSVGANTFVGQYIIQKRKQMMLDDNAATRRELKGRFPAAVRDQHIFEASLGATGGIEGRAGLFQETGFKVGSKRSKGYEKAAPLGASVVRDKSGLPIYDEKGNVVYTEGYSRKYKAGMDRLLGLRIYAG